MKRYTGPLSMWFRLLNLRSRHGAMFCHPPRAWGVASHASVFRGVRFFLGRDEKRPPLTTPAWEARAWVTWTILFTKRLAKQLLCFHAFLYISLSSLYDYDVKLPYLTSCRTWTQENDFLFLFRKFNTVFWNSSSEKFVNIWQIDDVE